MSKRDTRKALKEERDEARRMLAQAEERLRARDERWEVVLDGLLGDVQTRTVAFALMGKLGIDFSRDELAVKGALELLHRTQREYLVSRHFGASEVMVRSFEVRRDVVDQARFGGQAYGYSHSHGPPGGRYAIDERVRLDLEVIRRRPELSPHETMRMFYDLLNRAGMMTEEEERRRLGLIEQLPPSGPVEFDARFPPTEAAMLEALGDKDEAFVNGWTVRRCVDCRKPVHGGPTRCVTCAAKPELCGCGHAVHDRACNARDCACMMDLRPVGAASRIEPQK